MYRRLSAGKNHCHILQVTAPCISKEGSICSPCNHSPQRKPSRRTGDRRNFKGGVEGVSDKTLRKLVPASQAGTDFVYTPNIVACSPPGLGITVVNREIAEKRS